MGNELDCELHLENWKEYVERHLTLPSVMPLVAASWQRCAARLNPYQEVAMQTLSADHLLAAQVASFDLISVARPILEDIFQYVEGSDTAVLLVNNAGYVLDLVGDLDMLEFLRQHTIGIGTSLSENQVGNNAINVALLERVPARIVGAEHFLLQFHRLAGSAAPIFDLSGRTLGAIGLMTPAYCHHLHTLGLAVAGARAVEAQRHSDLLLMEQNAHLAELNAILASISEGLLVWSAEGILMHINAEAVKMIGQPLGGMVGQRVRDLFTLPHFVEEALRKRQPLNDVEASIQIGDRTFNCILSLQFVINKSELRWIIVTLRQEQDVLNLVHKQVGAEAASTLDDMTGDSPEIRRVRKVSKTAASARAPILLRGESGAGKTIIASAIHNESPRRDGPFLVFACSSIPSELMVAELVGYDVGFSLRQPGGRPSKFELAQNGTLYLQDVHALSLEAQAVLLNVLDLGMVQRLGSARAIPVDVRIIASTSANMEKAIAQSSFRADLYYRLSSFEIRLPALRERQKDLPLLVDRILKRLSRQMGHPLSLAPTVMELLESYPWPGNVRELEAVLGQAAAQAGPSEMIGPMHLPDYVLRPTHVSLEDGKNLPIQTLYELEREAFLQTARLCNGSVSKMTELLGVSRTTVWRRLKEFNISPQDFRGEI